MLPRSHILVSHVTSLPVVGCTRHQLDIEKASEHRQQETRKYKQKAQTELKKAIRLVFLCASSLFPSVSPHFVCSWWCSAAFLISSWFQIFLRLFLFSTETDNRWCTQFVWPISLKKISYKRAPDLVWFSKYSLFGPLCSVSFLSFVYILAVTTHHWVIISVLRHTSLRGTLP